ncbi:hypothetical protein CYXG_00071 [Synechococcus phage S-SSM4]|uniref:Uncharacterized protein n=1 Tax=Synechococcus phage S-SSM4 TaxID=536466 RepID=M1T278_9CAUD|nr:hypothetical protein CYXG_00071 [Synechococcus phage S-SSM4]AGG54135.1 hypothetical protein CYXG_00071 [Synechococcus phage S-SSM4]
MSAFDGLNEVFGTEPSELQKAIETKDEIKKPSVKNQRHKMSSKIMSILVLS